MVKQLFLLLWTINWVIIVNGQTPTPIYLKNPSFEGFYQAGKCPDGWDDVNAYNETPPDTQPFSFGVTKPAKDGNSYLGLVVRDNKTTEAVRQQLEKPLLKGVTYQLSLWACRSATYISQSRKTGQNNVNFNTPVLIEIWACNNGEDNEKLVITQPISTTEWEKLDLEFTTKKNYNYFIINTFYAENREYNGNVLIDNLSAIVPKKKKEVAPKKSKKTSSEQPISPTDPTTSEPPPPSFTNRLLNIPFGYDSADLPSSSYSDLDEYARILQANPSTKILIEGFTNNQINAQEAIPLSLKRAQAVCNYLEKKGIERPRLSAKGLGKGDLKGVKITLFK